MNCSTKSSKRQSKHSDKCLTVKKASRSKVTKRTKKSKDLNIFVKTEVTMQQKRKNPNTSLHISPVVSTEEMLTSTENCCNPVDAEHQINIKQEVISVIEERSTSSDIKPVDIQKEVTHKECSAAHKTKTKSVIIPLKVSDDVSDLIHGSNSRAGESIYKSSEYFLMNYGIHIRKGKWTPEEDRILRKNYKRALKDIPKDDHKYILNLTKDTPCKLQKRIKDLIRSTNFYGKLGRRLNRIPVSCIKRAKHIFKDYKHTGKFSAAEKEQLDKLVLSHGHKWNQFSRTMERSAYSLSSYFHKFKPKGGKGPFTSLEDQQLREAVMNVKKEYEIPNDQHQNMPWSEIARRVPTRNVIQCKVHWLRRVKYFDQSDSKGMFYKMANKKLLVELINNVEVAHEFDINWSEIAKEISSTLTPQYLQHYWHIMKKTYIPDYSLMSFDDVREYLFNKFHPSSSTDLV